MLETPAAKRRAATIQGQPRLLLVAPRRIDAERIAFVLNREGGFEIAGICHQVDVLDAIAALEPLVVLLAAPQSVAESVGICEGIRKGFEVAIVVCARDPSESEIVSGLEAGADDYLALPMHPAEFAARLRAVARRARESDFLGEGPNRLSAGELEVDVQQKRAYRNGNEIDLSPTEFRLLTSLVRQAGRPVSHSRLLAQAWGPEYTDARNYIRLYIKRLREKLEDNPDVPKLIVNERGIGYCFQPGAAA